MHFYAPAGETILYGVNGGDPSLYLPSAEILAALLEMKWHLSFRVRQSMTLVVFALLLLAIDGILGVPTIIGLAPVAAVIVCHWQYPHRVCSLLILIVAGFLIRYAKKPAYLNALWLAVAVGSTFLFRSEMALLPPAIALFAVAFWLPRRSSVRAKHALILVIVPYLFTLPVLQKNYGCYRRLIPFERGKQSGNIVSAAVGVVETRATVDDLIPGSVDLADRVSVLKWSIKEIGGHPLRYGVGYLLRVGRVIEWFSLFILFALWTLWTQRGRREFQALGLVVAYWIGFYCLMSIEERFFWPLQSVLILLMCPLAARLVSPGVAPPRNFSSAVLAGSLTAFLILDLYTVVRMYKPISDNLKQAIAISPNDWWLLKQRGMGRLRLGDSSQAASDFFLSKALLPADYAQSEVGLELESLLATAEMFQGRLERVWTLPIQDARTHLIRAYAWLKLDRPAKAKAEILIAQNRRLSGSRVFHDHTPSDRTPNELQAADEDGFIPELAETLDAWPNSEKSALATLLVSVHPRPEPARIFHPVVQQ